MAVFDRIVMDVIEVIISINFIADAVFPVLLLPYTPAAVAAL